MMRKLRKAQWVYECGDCGWTSYPSPDLFGAREAESWHQHMPGHREEMLRQAFVPIAAVVSDVVSAYANLARTIIEAVAPAMEQINYALMPPPNIPHDPSLLRDRRKWGGR